MLKYPRAGAVKTRLMPVLGAARACALYRQLVDHTLTEVGAVVAPGGIDLEIRLAGAPDETAARAWLGETRAIRAQGEGDLGARLERAVEAALAEGAPAVVVIGGDCPQLSAGHLESAFAALVHHEVVLGPATDGGYYLIGLRRSRPALFRGIAWGGPEVLAQTLTAAHALGLDVATLAPLSDLDVPEDLVRWARTPAAHHAGRGGVSVIIPALDEETALPATLQAAQRA
ncbi:MAG: DUF2064 domain-containing protein, partial [Verrucomicrobia bacterium]|nr:DUF2064 domain-containing protein [Verrucomicrobiota bacterium]